jgi:hypothetical protein
VHSADSIEHLEPPEFNEEIKRVKSMYVGIGARLTEEFQAPESKKGAGGGRSGAQTHWKDEEKEEFMRLLTEHGKNWELLKKLIPNKNEKQIKNFYQNYKHKLKLQSLLPIEVTCGIKREASSLAAPIMEQGRKIKRRRIESSDSCESNSCHEDLNKTTNLKSEDMDFES